MSVDYIAKIKEQIASVQEEHAKNQQEVVKIRSVLDNKIQYGIHLEGSYKALMELLKGLEEENTEEETEKDSQE